MSTGQVLSDTERIAFLGGIGLFAGLGREMLERVAAHTSEVRLAAGEVLFREGDPGSDIYLVEAGELAILIERSGGAVRRINTVSRGECIGEMGLFAAGNRSATVQAETAATLLKLERDSFQALLEEVPELRQVLGRIIEQRLPKLRAVLTTLFGQIDDAILREIEGSLSWRRLARGEVLFNEGDDGQELFLVVHGRLQVGKRTDERALRVLGELGPGEWVGEMSLIDGAPRSATVSALRDTDLLGLSREGFDKVVAMHPAILLPIVKVLARRLRHANARGDRATVAPQSLTVAIVPVTPLPELFIEALSEEFSRTGRVVVLSARAFDEIHGRNSAQTPASDPRSGHLSSWLSRIEDEYDYVLYVADQVGSEWSWRCKRHADRILYAIDFDTDRLRQLNLTLRDVQLVDVPKAAVLWHPAGTTAVPSKTRELLDQLGVRQHHHIRRGNLEDVKRIGRYLMNRPIGLCLSGGGARGFAHIGVYRALCEAGIAVDRVGGTSIGGFIGALIACQFDYEQIVDHARHVLADRGAFGWTLPLLSLLQVNNAERRLQSAFAGRDFEDMWLACFCCCTNLTLSRLAVFRSGAIWRAIRATTAVPGLCPPVFIKGEVYVDGAVLDNLPVDIMAADMPGPIIACDVTKATALRVDPALETTPSALRLLAGRLRGNAADRGLPSVGDVLMRTMDCTSRLRQQTNMEIASAYLTPPVGDYRLLDMQHFDALVEAGYRYASEIIDQNGLDGVVRYRANAAWSADFSATAN